MTYAEKLQDPTLLTGGIYKLIINEKIYVGSAVNLSKRLRSHLNALKKGKHRNRHLQSAFNKYQDIDFYILEYVDNKENLVRREQYYIDTLFPHYNISLNAGSQLGFRHTEETKIKISKIQIGRKVSDSARQNYSKAKKGIRLTVAHRNNLSASKTGERNPFYKAGERHPQYGTKRNAETIEKLSGINSPQSKSGVLYDVETGDNYVFRSLRKICGKLNLKYRGVLSALRKEKFYKNRYYANFMYIPGTHETIINKSWQE